MWAMRALKQFCIMLITAIVLVGCGFSRPTAAAWTPTTAATLEGAQEMVETPGPIPVQVDPVTPTPVELVVDIVPTQPVRPTPMLPEPPFQQVPLRLEERRALERLNAVEFRLNDHMALAASVLGVELPEGEFLTDAAYQPGDIEQFWVLNHTANTWSQISARLVRASEHAYFWFDTTQPVLSDSTYDKAVEGVETLMHAVREVYGAEEVDAGELPRYIHILHAGPRALCGLSACGIWGYFADTDMLPAAVNRHSNEREMFVLNAQIPVAQSGYFSTLAHEYRHMLEYAYDRQEDDWAVEGTAIMAQLLVGDLQGPKQRANAYMADTDIQLNAWDVTNPGANYGKGYVFSSYLLDRFGDDFYRAWVRHPGRSFSSLEKVLIGQGYATTAQMVWVDFSAAVALHNRADVQWGAGMGSTGAAMAHRFSPGFEANSARVTVLNDFPTQSLTDVRQFGIDIYEVQGEMPVTLQFTGALKTPVLPQVLPASGLHMWWSGRGNGSNITLTREVDLRGVPTATLAFDLFYDIEPGYDFGYVLVSEDNQQTWVLLLIEGMQGTSPSDDPGHRALAERFYSGVSEGWSHAQVDLTPYAGKVIWLRFKYLTDQILTEGGMALDNIAIPEIGFFDDAETGEGEWLAEGFTRVTGYIPQAFGVTLITFSAGGEPSVMVLALDDYNQAEAVIQLSRETPAALLVVTALAPQILTPAVYQLDIVQEAP